MLAAIRTRRDIRHVEVVSDYRQTYDNGFSSRLGYRQAVSELTDTFLYLSSLLAAGAALGVPRLFVASEAEVQDNVLLDGKIVQHGHFMYSAATQRPLARLLEPYGIAFGSLTWPLYSMQVQQLLWARYPDLCDLQYSCWQVAHGQATCSKCKQCVRIAMTSLASGEDPQRMGMDLRRVIAAAPRHSPFARSNRPVPTVLPQDIVGEMMEARFMNSVASIRLEHLTAVLTHGRSGKLLSPRTLKALLTFIWLRNRAGRQPLLPARGVREAFFEWLDPELGPSLVAIYTEHFPREPRADHIATFERSGDLAARATALLDHPSGESG